MRRDLSLLILMVGVITCTLGLNVDAFSQSASSAKRSKSESKSPKEPKKFQVFNPVEKEKKPKPSYDPVKNAAAQKGETIVLPMEYYGESEPLTELVKKQQPVSKENGKIQNSDKQPVLEDTTEPFTVDGPPSFVQTETLLPSAASLGISFEGPGTGLAGFALTGAPPDTTLAVGPTRIVAWVNSQYAIFDKSGTVVLAPINGNTLFAGVGGNCETTNRGDPILQYDRLADRWILSQFAFSAGTTAPYFQCIAVSTSGDPAGTYSRYTVAFSSTSPSGLNDYGKLGIWNDGYYTAYNMFAGSPAGSNTGTALCVSDRAKMLAADPTATTLCAPIAFYGGGASFLPADLDGPELPTDTTRGGVFMRVSTTLNLRILRLKPNFATSTVTLTDGYGGASGSFINFPIGATTNACNGAGNNCIAQPGTTTLLDTLGTRLMYRLAYRNRGGVDNLVVTHSVDPDGAGARGAVVRWYEIRNPLGDPLDPKIGRRPFLYQNGTYDPGASGDRWMASFATNKYGDILGGYSSVNAGTLLKPSIAVAGRGQGDTLSTLQAESLALTGTGSQTGGLSRWGDYSTMQVDPVDDTTFWFTTEYLAADGSFNWRTRVVSYSFPKTTATVNGDIGVPANWSNGLPSSTVTGIIPSGRTMTVGVDSTVGNLDVQSGGSLVMNANLDVLGSLTLGTTINTRGNTLGLGCEATVSGASATNYVIGKIRKDFCAANRHFNYPTGTASGYSPASVNVTLLPTNPSSLEIIAWPGNRNGMNAAESLQRYWTLTKTGDLTADLTFNYNQTDVNGNEASYKLFRWVGGVATAVAPFTLDTTANTMSANLQSTFSDWSVGNMAPTAAFAGISGIVLSRDRQALPRAIVTLTDGNGNILRARSNSFGFFRFEDIEVGNTYVLDAFLKGQVFQSTVINLNSDVVDLEIMPDN